MTNSTGDVRPDDLDTFENALAYAKAQGINKVWMQRGTASYIVQRLSKALLAAPLVTPAPDRSARPMRTAEVTTAIQKVKLGIKMGVMANSKEDFETLASAFAEHAITIAKHLNVVEDYLASAPTQRSGEVEEALRGMLGFAERVRDSWNKGHVLTQLRSFEIPEVVAAKAALGIE